MHRKTTVPWQHRSKRQRTTLLQNIGALYGNLEPIPSSTPLPPNNAALASPPKRSGKPARQEDEIQIRFIAWLHSHGVRCNHSPNEGKRTPLQGHLNKIRGVSRGFPDIEIPLPIKPYHGLYIELKRIGGKLTKEQDGWLVYLRSAGYYAGAAYGLEHAQKMFNDYIAHDPLFDLAKFSANMPDVDE